VVSGQWLETLGKAREGHHRRWPPLIAFSLGEKVPKADEGTDNPSLVVMTCAEIPCWLQKGVDRAYPLTTSL
jgi:hypothetical protein